MRSIGAVALALQTLPKPTIAKVRGVAAGAGCNMALACDLVVASDEARFTQIFVKRGMVVDFGGSWLLPRLIGMQRAKELAFFGDFVSAADAHGIGLVNRVLADGDLDAFVDEWAERLAAGPPLALSMTKSLLSHSFETSIEQALEDEARCQAVCIARRTRARRSRRSPRNVRRCSAVADRGPRRRVPLMALPLVLPEPACDEVRRSVARIRRVAQVVVGGEHRTLFVG